MNCGICGEHADSSYEFETGNNANYAAEMPLCAKHSDELEAIEHKFDAKYGDKILAFFENHQGEYA